MNILINLVFCALVVLTSSSPTKGQNSPSLPILTPVALPSEIGTSASPILPLDARDDTPNPEHNPASQTSAVEDGTAAVAEGDGLVQSETITDAGDGIEVTTITTRVTTPQHTAAVHTVNAVSPSHPTTAYLSAAPESPSSSSPTVESSTSPEYISTPGGTTVLAGDPHTTSAPPSTSPSQDRTQPQPSTQPSTEALTPAPTQPQTTGRPQTSAPSHTPNVPSHQEVPSELNVGDDDFKGPHHRPSSPLDPLLAGLVSVFIVTTAIISVVLFLKFRQRTDHPEFHRLQDLPMDDLMEDTPLSRYTH